MVSFLLDPGLLVASGVGIGALAPDEQSATAAEVGTMALFWGVSVSLWQDRRWIAWAPPLLGSESGRDFMLNSGALNLGVPLRFDASRRDLRRDLAAAAVFATYPLWLHAGRRIGRAIRRRVVSRRVRPAPDLGTIEYPRQESVM